MKIISALFLFVLLFQAKTPVERIPWSEDKKLSWEDFQGVPNATNSYVASTNSGISFSYSYSISNGKLDVTYKVQSNFYPKLSWYLPERVNSYILKHEQTHFDISELHARKLRKRLSETVFSSAPKKQIEGVYQKVEQERRAMQEQFDLESDHSKDVAGELKWERFIATELQKYDRWK